MRNQDSAWILPVNTSAFHTTSSLALSKVQKYASNTSTAHERSHCILQQTEMLKKKAICSAVISGQTAVYPSAQHLCAASLACGELAIVLVFVSVQPRRHPAMQPPGGTVTSPEDRSPRQSRHLMCRLLSISSHSWKKVFPELLNHFLRLHGTELCIMSAVAGDY